MSVVGDNDWPIDEASGLRVEPPTQQTLSDNQGPVYGANCGENLPYQADVGVHGEALSTAIASTYGVDVTGLPCFNCKTSCCGRVVQSLGVVHAQSSTAVVDQVLPALKEEQRLQSIIETSDPNAFAFAAATEAMAALPSIRARVCCNESTCLVAMGLKSPQKVHTAQNLAGHNARHGIKEALEEDCAVLHLLFRDKQITADEAALLGEDVQRHSPWLKHYRVQMYTCSRLLVDNAVAFNLPLEGHMGATFATTLKSVALRVFETLLLPHVLNLNYPGPTYVGGKRVWTKGTAAQGAESATTWPNRLSAQLLLKDFPPPQLCCRALVMINNWTAKGMPRHANGQPHHLVYADEWSILYDAPQQQDAAIKAAYEMMKISKDHMYQNGLGSSTGHSDAWRSILAGLGCRKFDALTLLAAVTAVTDKHKPGSITKGGTNEFNVEYAAADNSCLVLKTKNDPLKRVYACAQLLRCVDPAKHSHSTADIAKLVLKPGATKPAANGTTQSGYHFRNVAKEEAEKQRPEFEVQLTTRAKKTKRHPGFLDASGPTPVKRKVCDSLHRRLDQVAFL